MSVTEEFQRMVQWWHTLEAPIAHRLAPGLDEATVRDRFTAAGLTPNHELVEFWTCHNGVLPQYEDDPASQPIRNWSLLSLNNALVWYTKEAWPDVTGPFQRGTILRTEGQEALARVQRRRILPTVVIQGLQRVLHATFVEPMIAGRSMTPPRLLTGAWRRFPALSVVPAAVVGIGPRPEKAPAWAHRQAAPATVS